jgi:hypothetical protein
MEDESSFDALPLAVRVQLAAIGPLLLGAVCGFCLHVSEGAWWGVNAAGAVGGFAGGLDYRTVGPAVRRGLLAGALFGLGVVIADAVAAGEAHAPLPSPTALIIVISTLVGGSLAALGSRLRARAEGQRT